MTSAISNHRRHGPHRQDGKGILHHRFGHERSWPASPSSWAIRNCCGWAAWRSRRLQPA